MRLFSTDLYRNFGIGFVLGAVAIVGLNADDWAGAVASPAHAAEIADGASVIPAPTAEFVIPSAAKD
ncbi:hypothetical protein [Erythrobacter neustonensis]|uniref:Uncharacterized protein n=1 Tax=Erythrobacter neustonensis TaxID=1112 RepID=A0A192D322_9SPHN|nr:hypothetical protein [Erythrobacter neustonensis]ANK12396.1 hypothetical protein A9D12_04920 [Erythrobacter neustonensis]